MLVSCEVGSARLAKLASVGRKSLLELGNLSSKLAALGVFLQKGQVEVLRCFLIVVSLLISDRH